MATHMIQARCGELIWDMWRSICAGHQSNTAAMAAIIENYYWRHQMGPVEDEEDTMDWESLKVMIESYLDNGAFEASEYARIEFAGLTAMLAEDDWPPERIANGPGPYIDDLHDYDGLGDYAHEKARAEGLEPGRDYR